jgi:hypothetical protein
MGCLILLGTLAAAVQEEELDRLDVQQLRTFLNYFIRQLATRLPGPDLFEAACAAWVQFESADAPEGSPPIPFGAFPAQPAAAAQPAGPAQLALQPAAAPQAHPAAAAGPGPFSAFASPSGAPRASAAAASAAVQPAAAPAATPYYLRLSHNCQAQSCSDPTCLLCQHNPVKRCRANLREDPHTYTVDEVVTSPCGAMLQISLCDAQGVPAEIPAELQGLMLMLAAIDDRRYREMHPGGADAGPDAAAAAAREQCLAPLGADACLILRGNDGAPSRCSLLCRLRHP